MQQIRVLIADDHAILRSGLRLLIGAQSDMMVAGEAGTANEAISAAMETDPDVVLIDITMPGGGIHAIEQILKNRPETRVLVLTMHEDSAYLRSVFAVGASGYVVKKAADSELLTAIRAVHRGRMFIDSSQLGASRALPDEFHGGKSKAQRTTPSERELQVLVLLAQGYTNQQIAERIFLSVKTVETYRSRVTKKLGLKSRADIVRYALETGLLKQE